MSEQTRGMGRVQRSGVAPADPAPVALTPEQVLRIEWCEMLEGMLSRALNDAELSSLDALSAASTRLTQAEPDRPPLRRLGMERCAAWRERWECEQAIEDVREDLRRSGAANMSEEELIQAAEMAQAGIPAGSSKRRLMEDVSWEVLVFMAVADEPEERRAGAVAEMERRLGNRPSVVRAVTERFAAAEVAPIGLAPDWEPGWVPWDVVVERVGPESLDRTMEDVERMLWPREQALSSDARPDGSA